MVGNWKEHSILIQESHLNSAQFSKWVLAIISINSANGSLEMDGVSWWCYNGFVDGSAVILGKAACQNTAIGPGIIIWQLSNTSDHLYAWLKMNSPLTHLDIWVFSLQLDPFCHLTDLDFNNISSILSSSFLLVCSKYYKNEWDDKWRQAKTLLHLCEWTIRGRKLNPWHSWLLEVVWDKLLSVLQHWKYYTTGKVW